MLHKRSFEVAIDASDTHCGISQVYSDKPEQYWFGFDGFLAELFKVTIDSPIRIKEMFAMLVCLQCSPSNCNLRIWTDNQANIFGVASGGGRYLEDSS